MAEGPKAGRLVKKKKKKLAAGGVVFCGNEAEGREAWVNWDWRPLKGFSKAACIHEWELRSTQAA